MTEQRLVECQDCGYRWESTAGSPRCSKADCGRSRNVEPVADDLGDEDADEADDPEDDEGNADTSPSTSERSEATDEGDDDDPEDDEGYTPAFETEQTRSDTGRGQPSGWPSDDEDDDAEETTDEDADDGEDFETEEVPDLDPEQLKPAIEATFGVIGTSRGEHWELEDDEAENLAEAWAPVANHYAPQMMQEHAIVVVAAITTYSVIGPRVAEDRRQAEQEAAQERRERDTEEGTVRGERTEDLPDEDDAGSIEATIDADAEIGGYADV